VIAVVDGAQAIYAAEPPEIAGSEQATLELSDSPEGEPFTPTSVALAQAPVNLYTTESVALRVTMRADWARLRAHGSVAFISGAPCIEYIPASA
jgi:hypothetical protein